MAIVREFRPEDAATVRDLMKRLAQQRKESDHHLVLKDQYERFFPAYLQGFLKDPDSVLRVAEADGKVVGYAIATRIREPAFYRYSKVARVSDVFVQEAYRGRGVAHELIADLDAWARKAGLQALEVEVFPEHEQEIQSLKGLGFSEYRTKFLRPVEGRAA